MAWGLQQRDLPILTPGQMNPFNQAFQAGLENYMNINKAAYQPLTSLADISSKAAYAAYTPAGMAAKVLGNPLSVAWLSKYDPAQLKQLMSTASNIPNNPIQYISGWGNIGRQPAGHITNEPAQSNYEAPDQSYTAPQEVSTPAPVSSNNNQPTTMIDNSADVLSDITGGTTPAVAPQTSTPSAAVSQPIAETQQGSLPNYEAGQALPIAPAATAPNAKQNDYFDAYMAKNFPLSQQGIASQAGLKKTEADIELDKELWKKTLLDKQHTINQSNQTIANDALLKKYYDKLHSWEKGTFLGLNLGNYTPTTSNAQSFDQVAKVQATNNVRALQSGHITNTDFEIGDKLKPYRGMNRDAFENALAYNNALALRDQESQRFYAEAKRKGYTAADADTMWAKYIQDHPLFDANGTLSQRYTIGPAKTVNRSPTANQAPQQTKIPEGPPAGAWPSNKEPLNTNDPKIQGHEPPADNIWMVTPGGMQVPVHKKNINYAKEKLHYRKINE